MFLTPHLDENCCFSQDYAHESKELFMEVNGIARGLVHSQLTVENLFAPSLKRGRVKNT